MTMHGGETQASAWVQARNSECARAELGAEWDEFLRRTPGGEHVQSSAWGEVKRRGGLTTHHAIVRREGRIVAGAQMLTRRLSVLGRIGFVPYGPVCEGDDPELCRAVLQELDRCMREHRIRALIVQPPAGGQKLADALDAQGFMRSPFEVAPSATLRLPLSSDTESMLSRVRASVRRNIRNTANAGVTVRQLRADEVSTFYGLYCASAARQGFTPIPLAHVQQQLDVLGPSGGIRMFVAELGTEALGSVLMACFGDNVTYKLPGFSPSGRLRPADFLVWQVISWAAAEGFRWFDFGGVSRGYATDLLAGTEPGDWPDRGAAEFKRGFHGEPYVFPEPYLVIQNAALRSTVRHLASTPLAVRVGQATLLRLRRA